MSKLYVELSSRFCLSIVTASTVATRQQTTDKII